MLAAVKSAILTTFNGSRLGQAAHFQPPVRQPSRSPFGLSAFPQELLTMILEELDWKDILRVRRVSKTLHEVSKVRNIWLNFCRPLLSPTATAPQTIHLERPIRLYQSHELEFLFLRFKSAEVGWKTDDNCAARRREVITTNVAKSMYLVEGGRWLLVASVTGCVSYFDLDASTPTERILVPAQFDISVPDPFDPSAETKIEMAIDRDNESAFLAFNLAISFCSSENYDPDAQVVQIWRITLSLDDNQLGIGLEAERMASFPFEPSIGRVFCQSIFGPHIAFSLLSMDHEGDSLTFVIDWKQANGDQINYPRHLLQPPDAREPAALHLLPGNKLITITHDGVMVFDYLDVPVTTSLPPFDFTDATVMPIWEARDLDCIAGLRQSSISRPFFCSHSIRFSILKRHSMYGIIISYPCNEDPTEPLAEVVKLLGSIDFSHSCERYGYNKAALFIGDTACLVGYSWPDEHNRKPTAGLLEKEVPPLRCTFGPFLDESSGRVVISSNRHSEPKHGHDVWDFALLYK